MLVFFFLLFIVACENISTSEFQYDQVYVKVSRGAFSYDSFTLRDDSLQYNITDAGIKYGNENKPGETNLNSSEVLGLAKYIVDNDFFSLEEEYKTETTDKSSLTVEVEIDGVKKQVFCEDFERECPPLLNDINQKIQELYDKELLPTQLPG